MYYQRKLDMVTSDIIQFPPRFKLEANRFVYQDGMEFILKKMHSWSFYIIIDIYWIIDISIWYSSEAKHCNCKIQVEINALGRTLVGQYVCWQVVLFVVTIHSSAMPI